MRKVAVGSLPPQILPLLAFFPQFYSKKWPKRDVANLPHLSIFTFLVKMAQKGPGTAIPSIF